MQHIACSRSTYRKSTPGQKMHILGADITSRDVYFLLAGAGSCAALSYVAYKFLAPPESLAINQEFIRRTVGKGKDKVTNVMDLEEIGNEAWFCRCWQSKKFPFCDGTHSQMKLVTGPLGIKRRSAAPEDKQ